MLSRIIALAFLATLSSSCLPPALLQPDLGTRHLGTFEHRGNGFKEVIVIEIREADGLQYQHDFYLDGEKTHSESGTVEVSNLAFTFSDFTKFVDYETGHLLESPEKQSRYFFTLLREGDPETDRLLPSPEHLYYLEKQSPE